MERPSRPAGRPGDERAEVVRWLADFLAAGPLPAAEVREAAETQGFAYGTLRKAFRQLGGAASRIESTKVWQWGLSEQSVTVPNTGAGV